MKRNLFFMIFLSLGFANAHEVTLNSDEDAILSYPDDVIATNCSPSDFGQISSIHRVKGLKEQRLLKFSPNNRTGEVVCSAKTIKHGVITSLFKLRRGVKRPIVEIPLKINKTQIQNINYFERFIKNDLSGFTEITTKGKVKTKDFYYYFVKKYQSAPSLYLYKLEVVPRDKKKGYSLLNIKTKSQIIYSHYKNTKGKESPGISNNSKTFLYLMTKGSVHPNKIKRYLQ